MKCPSCDGKGYNVGYACPGFRLVRLDCQVCDGGNLAAEGDQRLKKGQAMRDDRIARDMSLREEAKRLGISPVELSRIEHGVKP